jgi:pyrroloquinoline quinone biosynthesis protein D
VVPSLARRARVRWDAARDCHVLLYPEGVLVLTPEAAEVIERVDGVRTLEAIVDALADEHPEAPREVIDRDVRELIERLAARGFVRSEAP